MKKKAAIILLAVLFWVACSTYRPEILTGYDILNPNEEVRKNPLAFTDDGNLIVNQSFILWVFELKEEIKRLRAEIARLEKK